MVVEEEEEEGEEEEEEDKEEEEEEAARLFCKLWFPFWYVCVQLNVLEGGG